MYNLVQLKDLKEYQMDDSLDLLIELEPRGQKLELCKELAMPESIASYFKAKKETGIDRDSLDVLLEKFSSSDRFKEKVIELALFDGSGIDVNLVVLNDEDYSVTWRECLHDLLEKFEIIAEVR